MLSPIGQPETPTQVVRHRSMIIDRDQSHSESLTHSHLLCSALLDRDPIDLDAWRTKDAFTWGWYFALRTDHFAYSKSHEEGTSFCEGVSVLDPLK